MRYVIGIDEVGRGSLAGPVTVCAALVPARFSFRWPRAPGVLKDSKQLSPVAREAWVKYLRIHTRVAWAVASEAAKTVDHIGIRDAANRAAARALMKLIHQRGDVARPHGRPTSGSSVVGCQLVLDAGLTVPPTLIKMLGISSIRCFPKADERVPAVAVASIIAKVHRDAHMRRLHRRLPVYGFDSHKGYGTTAHRKAIRRHGASLVHRLTFLGNYRRPSVRHRV